MERGRGKGGNRRRHLSRKGEGGKKDKKIAFQIHLNEVREQMDETRFGPHVGWKIK